MPYRDNVRDSEDVVSSLDEHDGLLLNEKDSHLSHVRLAYLSRYHHHMLLVVELILLVFNVGLLIFTFVARPSSVQAGPHSNVADLRAYTSVEAPYSPALENVEWTVTRIDSEDPDDPFTGEWRPELDEAWDKLMSHNTMRFSADEMRAIDLPAVEYTDGSGYYGFLEVYHQLHCIQRIYQGRYPEKYPELAAGGFLGPEHWNHCLQVLRKGVMCQPQLNINTMIRNMEAPPANLTALINGARKCVDWEAFEEWADTRSVYDGVVHLMSEGKLADNGPPDVWEKYQKVHNFP